MLVNQQNNPYTTTPGFGGRTSIRCYVGSTKTRIPKANVVLTENAKKALSLLGIRKKLKLQKFADLNGIETLKLDASVKKHKKGKPTIIFKTKTTNRLDRNA